MDLSVLTNALQKVGNVVSTVSNISDTISGAVSSVSSVVSAVNGFQTNGSSKSSVDMATSSNYSVVAPMYPNSFMSVSAGDPGSISAAPLDAKSIILIFGGVVGVGLLFYSLMRKRR